MKRQYDILLMADHFVMVTTIITDESPDKRDLEDAAWKRLADEYGDEWVNTTKPFINQVSIEEPFKESVDDSDVCTIPEAGDPADAGIDGA
jgi:RNase P/RNase MRP subunit POP5